MPAGRTAATRRDLRCAIRPAAFADIAAVNAVRRGVRENRPGRLAVTEACYRPYVAAGSA